MALTSNTNFINSCLPVNNDQKLTWDNSYQTSITEHTPTGTEWCFLRAPFIWKAAKQEAQNFSQHSTQFYNTKCDIINNNNNDRRCKEAMPLPSGVWWWMKKWCLKLVWLMLCYLQFFHQICYVTESISGSQKQSKSSLQEQMEEITEGQLVNPS